MSWDNDTKLSKNFYLREFTKSQTAARHGIDNFVYDEEVFIATCFRLAGKQQFVWTKLFLLVALERSDLRYGDSLWFNQRFVWVFKPRL